MRALFFIFVLLKSFVALGCGSGVAGAGSPTFDTGEGPYFPAPSMIQGLNNDLTDKGQAEGRLLYIKGRVTTVDGSPRANTLVILWQADRNGWYYQHTLMMFPAQPHFGYIGATRTNENGEYSFYTLRPPSYGIRSAHIHMATSRTSLWPLFTEIHFADDTTPERALNLTSPEAQELIKASTPGTIEFEGGVTREAEIIEFNIRVN